MISDMTGSQWISVFQEHAEKLIGKSAHQLGQMVENKVHN